MPDEALREAVERLSEVAAERERGVQRDRAREERVGPKWGDEQFANARKWATVQSVALDDLQTVLSALAGSEARVGLDHAQAPQVAEAGEVDDGKLTQAPPAEPMSEGDRVAAINRCVAQIQKAEAALSTPQPEGYDARAREVLVRTMRERRYSEPNCVAAADACSSFLVKVNADCAIDAITAALRSADQVRAETVEECARVADRFAEHHDGDDEDADRFDKGYAIASQSVGAAIRALNPRKPIMGSDAARKPMPGHGKGPFYDA